MKLKLIISLLIIFTLAGCGNKDTDKNLNENTTEETTIFESTDLESTSQAQATDDSTELSLAGTYTLIESEENLDRTMVFNEDGSGFTDTDGDGKSNSDWSWEQKDGKLEITYDGETEACVYSFDGEKLSIDFDDGSTVVLQKKNNFNVKTSVFFKFQRVKFIKLLVLQHKLK